MARRKERPFSASGISVYLYCARAWWYRRQGVEPQDQARLAQGAAAHWAHGRRIWRARVLRWVGYVALAAALVWLAVYWALRAVEGG